MERREFGEQDGDARIELTLRQVGKKAAGPVFGPLI